VWNIVLDRKVESGSVNASLTARDDFLQSSQLVAHGLITIKAVAQINWLGRRATCGGLLSDRIYRRKQFSSAVYLLAFIFISFFAVPDYLIDLLGKAQSRHLAN
jgi:hypothetical protein